MTSFDSKDYTPKAKDNFSRRSAMVGVFSKHLHDQPWLEFSPIIYALAGENSGKGVGKEKDITTDALSFSHSNRSELPA
jgi:hypothetical protein